MIIQCEQCKTRFRIDDSRIKPTGSRVKCSRCGNVFSVYREEQSNIGFRTQSEENSGYYADEEKGLKWEDIYIEDEGRPISAHKTLRTTSSQPFQRGSKAPVILTTFFIIVLITTVGFAYLHPLLFVGKESSIATAISSTPMIKTPEIETTEVIREKQKNKELGLAKPTPSIKVLKTRPTKVMQEKGKNKKVKIANSTPKVKAPKIQSAKEIRENEKRQAEISSPALIVKAPEVQSIIDLSGKWELVDIVEYTFYPPYQRMQVGYRVFLHQHGTSVTGKGEKWWENGRKLPLNARSPLYIKGTLEGTTLTAIFVEKGIQRTTVGSFIWSVSPDTRKLHGSFTSTVANSRGTSIGNRIASIQNQSPSAD